MISVFKTSVHDKSGVMQIAPLLNKLVQKEGRWNFDLEDCDKILRVESRTLTPSQVVYSLTKVGFICEELMD